MQNFFQIKFDILAFCTPKWYKQIKGASNMIDKSIIQGFAQPAQEEVVNSALEQATGIVRCALADIAQRNPYVSSDFELIVVGDFSSGAVVNTSCIELLLVVSTPEIALNTQNLYKNRWQTFCTRLKSAWKSRKKPKKRRKKSKFQQQKEDIVVYHDPKRNYSMPLFCADMVKSISKFITKDEFVAFSSQKIVVKGENLPYKIHILPVLQNSGDSDKYRFYQENKKHLQILDLAAHDKNLQNLFDEYGEQVIVQIRMFSRFFAHFNNLQPSPYFIESLIANLPDEAFANNDAYENFLFAINFLLCQPINQLFSINDPSKKIYQDTLCGVTLIEISNFFKKIATALSTA